MVSKKLYEKMANPFKLTNYRLINLSMHVYVYIYIASYLLIRNEFNNYKMPSANYQRRLEDLERKCN
jgi:hypothetical protein